MTLNELVQQLQDLQEDGFGELEVKVATNERWPHVFKFESATIEHEEKYAQKGEKYVSPNIAEIKLQIS